MKTFFLLFETHSHYSSSHYQLFLFNQVKVLMEYSRKVGLADGASTAAGAADSRVMDFGSVFLASPLNVDGDDAASGASSTPDKQPVGLNVAELVVARGFGTVIRHRDFEERSNYYDCLLAAEARAISGRKGMHSSKDPPVMHITDLVTVRGILAVIDYIFSTDCS